MNWFTSDLHLGDERLNLYGRDISINAIKKYYDINVFAGELPSNTESA